jgi:hypothetical protein
MSHQFEPTLEDLQYMLAIDSEGSARRVVAVLADLVRRYPQHEDALHDCAFTLILDIIGPPPVGGLAPKTHPRRPIRADVERRRVDARAQPVGRHRPLAAGGVDDPPLRPVGEEERVDLLQERPGRRPGGHRVTSAS